MLNQVIKASSEHVNSFLRMLSKSVKFLNFRISQGSVATYCRWCKNLWYVHREFSYESTGERILKIGPHLPKLLSNIKQLTFFGTLCKIRNKNKNTSSRLVIITIRSFCVDLHSISTYVHDIQLSSMSSQLIYTYVENVIKKLLLVNFFKLAKRACFSGNMLLLQFCILTVWTGAIFFLYCCCIQRLCISV